MLCTSHVSFPILLTRLSVSFCCVFSWRGEQDRTGYFFVHFVLKLKKLIDPRVIRCPVSFGANMKHLCDCMKRSVVSVQIQFVLILQCVQFFYFCFYLVFNFYLLNPICSMLAGVSGEGLASIM